MLLVLFHTRHQTTKGIWIAKAVGIEPFTVVLDLEGTDGRERGQVKVLLAAISELIKCSRTVFFFLIKLCFPCSTLLIDCCGPPPIVCYCVLLCVVLYHDSSCADGLPNYNLQVPDLLCTTAFNLSRRNWLCLAINSTWIDSHATLVPLLILL